MSAESDLVAILDGGGTTAGTRVYPVLLPDVPVFPAVTYQGISQVPQQHRSADTRLDRLRFQVNAWGKTFEQARILADELRELLNRASGGSIGRIWVEDSRDDFDTGAELFVRQMDVIAWFTRS